MARHSIEVTLGKLQITSVNWVDGTWIVVAESRGVEPARRRATARIAEGCVTSLRRGRRSMQICGWANGAAIDPTAIRRFHRAPAQYCGAVRAEDATPGGSGRSAWSRYRRPPGRLNGQQARNPSEQGQYLWNGLPFDPQKGVKLRRRNTREVTDLPPEQRRVGLMFQNFGMFPHLTVVGNVASGLRARRRGGHADAGRGIADLLSLFGSSHHADRYLQHLGASDRSKVCAP
jgi:hypothetical protein